MSRKGKILIFPAFPESRIRKTESKMSGIVLILDSAGWVLYPLLGCSVSGLAIFLYSWVQIRSGFLMVRAWTGLNSAEDSPLAEDLERGSDSQSRSKSMNRYLPESLSPKSRALLADPDQGGFFSQPKSQESDWDIWEDIWEEWTLPIQIKVSWMSILATVSTLLGLFGTVLGISSAFESMENAGKISLDEFASGIRLALSTTILGLSIAIPTYILQQFLKSKLIEWESLFFRTIRAKSRRRDQ